MRQGADIGKWRSEYVLTVRETDVATKVQLRSSLRAHSFPAASSQTPITIDFVLRDRKSTRLNSSHT